MDGSARKTRERGSALLLMVLLATVGSAFVGLTIDSGMLLWVRTRAQTTADASAAAAAVELRRNPGLTDARLESAVRAIARLNGYQHGTSATTVMLERTGGQLHVQVSRDAETYFLRLVRQPVVPITASAPVRL